VTLFLDAHKTHKTPPHEIILDLDATDDPLHGHQEGRFFHGYYNCYCYLPRYRYQFARAEGAQDSGRCTLVGTLIAIPQMIADIPYAGELVGPRARASNLFSSSWLRATAFRRSFSSLSMMASLAAASECKYPISRSFSSPSARARFKSSFNLLISSSRC
jgi:hypothetical protein